VIVGGDDKESKEVSTVSAGSTSGAVGMLESMQYERRYKK